MKVIGADAVQSPVYPKDSMQRDVRPIGSAGSSVRSKGSGNGPQLEAGMRYAEGWCSD